MSNTLELVLNPTTATSVQKALLTLPNPPELDVCVQASEPVDNALNGVRTHCRVRVEGELGDFCGMSFGEAEAQIDGSVGHYFAHSLQSGLIVVRGNAKDSLGALGCGGLLAVYGSAADRVGVGLQGSDIIVRGNVGALAGVGMQSGTLIIGGNAGQELGKGLGGGTIYLRGEAASVSPDVEEVRGKESDKLRIGLLMLKAGIKAAGKDFKVFRSVH